MQVGNNTGKIGVLTENDFQVIVFHCERSEFKIETARLIVEGGRKISDVARDFDIHENVLRK